jgi:hypothetical protein
MKLIRTAALALAVGVVFAASSAPANAFFFHHKDAKAATAKHPICAFFEALFHKK